MWKCVIPAPPRERSREPFKKDVPLNRTEDSHTLVSQCGVGWIPLPRVHLDSLRNTLYALTPSNRKLVLWPPCLTQRSGLSCSSICIHKAQSHSHQVARATVRWGRYSIKICGQTYKMGAEGAGGGVVQEKKNVRLQPTKKKIKKRQTIPHCGQRTRGWVDRGKKVSRRVSRRMAVRRLNRRLTARNGCFDVCELFCENCNFQWQATPGQWLTLPELDRRYDA